jgi:hypothetical protein
MPGKRWKFNLHGSSEKNWEALRGTMTSYGIYIQMERWDESEPS